MNFLMPKMPPRAARLAEAAARAIEAVTERGRRTPSGRA
jgi:hypothetical protein